MLGRYNPYWWLAQRSCTQPGIVRLDTNAVELGDDSVNYGVSPMAYTQLPEQCIALLTINADVPDGGSDLSVAILIPNSGQSTLGSIKVTLVDKSGDDITGSEIQAGYQTLAYINKKDNIIKVL